MKVHLRDTFLASLSCLEGRAAAAAKRAAFDLLASTARPGLRLHRLVHAVDRGLWSVRVNRELRIIVHRERSELSLCYVDHHDRAYAWAEQRAASATAGGAAEPLEVTLPPDAETRRGHLGSAGKSSAGRPTILPRLRVVPPRAPPPPPPSRPAAASQRRRRTWRRAVAPVSEAEPHFGEAARALPSPSPPLLALLELLRDTEPLARTEASPGAGRDHRGASGPAHRPVPVALGLALLATAVAMALALHAAAGHASGISERTALATLTLVPAALAAGQSLLRRRALRRAGAAVERCALALRAGDLQARCAPAGVDASLRPLLSRMDAAVEAAALPAVALCDAVSALSPGEPPGPPAVAPDRLQQAHGALARLTRFLLLEPADIRHLTSAAARPPGRAPAPRADAPGDPRPAAKPTTTCAEPWPAPRPA